MRNVLITFLIVALALPVYANAQTYSGAQSVRIGTKVVQPGDSVKKFVDEAEPDARIDLINNFGVKKGEEWQYKRGARSWTIIRVDNYGRVFEVLDMIE